MTDSECENLALGKVATMSEDQDHNYAMLAVDGNKYEPDMCVTLTSRSNKLMWWSVNLGHEYVVGFVNIYYYTTSKYTLLSSRNSAHTYHTINYMLNSSQYSTKRH